MNGAIANMIKTPVDSIITHGIEYKSSKEEKNKDLFKTLLVFFLKTLTKNIESIVIVGMDKGQAMEDLKFVDMSLDKMDELIALLEEKNDSVDAELTKELNAFYEALDNLSCSLSCYVDEECMSDLDKIARGDYSDFVEYQPDSYE